MDSRLYELKLVLGRGDNPGSSITVDKVEEFVAGYRYLYVRTVKSTIAFDRRELFGLYRRKQGTDRWLKVLMKGSRCLTDDHAQKSVQHDGPGTCSPSPATTDPVSAAESKFQQLAKTWREETAYLSSIKEIVLNFAYQQIIGMGKEALPFILRELKRQPDHWFWALSAITGEDPVPVEEKGDVEAMTERWINFGLANNWIGQEDVSWKT